VGSIELESVTSLLVGLPLALSLLALSGRALARRGLGAGRTAVLLALRTTATLILLGLLARPVRVEHEPPKEGRTVALLLDKSQSMSLAEAGETRFGRARALGIGLVAALAREGYDVKTYLFAEGAEPAPPERWGVAAPDGAVTDLAGAISQAVSSLEPPPLAVVALTDGAANETAGNRGAVAALLDTGTPFVGVGFGNDGEHARLSLRQLVAPPVVPPRQQFQVEALVEALAEGDVPPYDLVLLRDGRFHSRKTVAARAGSRFGSESFPVVEDEEGVHQYTVELVLPRRGDLILASTQASAQVRVTREKELRVLYVQGALTWDFKFIGRALREDPSIRVTGLSRTSSQSVFRQNVESAGELLSGFPETLDQMAPYRVLVLSDQKPADLTPAQQELVARFCSELGGGVLLVGGAQTFDGSWQGSRLEQLLPVTFDPAPGVLGLDRPFRLRLTAEALGHPAFQITDRGGNREAWEALPTFTQYGRLLGAKPGAAVWATHEEDRGPHGPRVLMASQSYGAGVAAVIAVQNFWRWRLAKDADPARFDRFWQQLFRHLGQAARQDVAIQLPDQDLAPGLDLRLVLEKTPRPEAQRSDGRTRYAVRVEAPDRTSLLDQSLELAPLRPVEVTFRAPRAGVYAVTVRDERDATVATRAVEVRDVNREMLRTGRDLETLRQWARLSQGFALPAEECADGLGLVSRLRKQTEEQRAGRSRRVPVGLDGWMLAALLGSLGGEWLLRRRLGLA
jgi:uncharacterized membrane protein